MYVQFDMHTAPGYQNPGHHSDNPNEQVRESVRFWADWNNVRLAAKIWGHIARRYADEPVIWSWDLLNEPVTRNEQEKARLEESYRVMAAAIRAVDRNHIISIQGDWWGSDFGPLDEKWDERLVFQTHHYRNKASRSRTIRNPAAWASACAVRDNSMCRCGSVSLGRIRRRCCVTWPIGPSEIPSAMRRGRSSASRRIGRCGQSASPRAINR